MVTMFWLFIIIYGWSYITEFFRDVVFSSYLNQHNTRLDISPLAHQPTRTFRKEEEATKLNQPRYAS